MIKIGKNIRSKEILCCLLRKTKTEYFKNLNVKDLSDNRKFWKIMKPYFSNKGLNSNKLLMKERGNLVSDEKEPATIMNNFFINITKDLKLKKDREGKLSVNILAKSVLPGWGGRNKLRKKRKEISFDPKKIYMAKI